MKEKKDQKEKEKSEKESKDSKEPKEKKEKKESAPKSKLNQDERMRLYNEALNKQIVILFKINFLCFNFKF